MLTENQLQALPDSQVDCLRCEPPMKDAGSRAFHEGEDRGVQGFANVVHLQVYACPRCGKVELFL